LITKALKERAKGSVARQGCALTRMQLVGRY